MHLQMPAVDSKCICPHFVKKVHKCNVRPELFFSGCHSSSLTFVLSSSHGYPLLILQNLMIAPLAFFSLVCYVFPSGVLTNNLTTIGFGICSGFDLFVYGLSP